MARKKRKGGRPWWQRRRAQQRLAVAASLALAIGIIAWPVVQGGGDSEPEEYFVEPALPFTVATIAEEEFSLADHRDRHVMLLYFNEGTG